MSAAIIAQAGRSPMQTECTPDLFGFAPVEGRRVEAAFDGGQLNTFDENGCGYVRQLQTGPPGVIRYGDEWAVQRARYKTLETISQMSDDPQISLTDMAR